MHAKNYDEILPYCPPKLQNIIAYSGLNLNQDKAASRRQYTRYGKASQCCTVFFNSLYFDELDLLSQLDAVAYAQTIDRLLRDLQQIVAEHSEPYDAHLNVSG